MGIPRLTVDPLEIPPSFLVRTECEKVAWDNGWRVTLPEQGGWILRASHDAPARIGIAAAGPQGPWFLAIDHAGVASEMGAEIDLPGPFVARFAYLTAGQLYQAVSRAYDLAKSLPDDPLRRFHEETGSMPKATEAERLVVARVGQEIFRDALMRYWRGKCPLTGITDPALLRASHIKPWADCSSDAERMDAFNGLLLSALWDAAFDRHLVTFSEIGEPIYSKHLSEVGRRNLQAVAAPSIPLSDAHRHYLKAHRSTFDRKLRQER